MKHYNKVSLLILSMMVLFLLSTVGSFAQTTNNPNDDPEANACYEGGTLYDTCNSMDADLDGDIDQDDIDWMWTCGYYLIRVEYGMYSSDILDGICMEIIIEVEEVVEVKKKKKKIEIIDTCEEPERSLRVELVICPE